MSLPRSLTRTSTPEPSGRQGEQCALRSPAATKEVAEAKKVEFVDLFATSAELYRAGVPRQRNPFESGSRLAEVIAKYAWEEYPRLTEP